MRESNTLSQNLDDLWKSSNLTQQEFGAKYGSNQKSLWAYINGVNTRPNADFLFRLCEDYQIDVDFLKNTRVKLKDGRVTNYKRTSQNRAQMIRILSEMKEIRAAFAAEMDSKISEVERLVKALPR